MIKPQTRSRYGIIGRSRRTLFLILPIVLLFSCQQGRKNATPSGWPGIADTVASGMLGSYSGHFKNGLLTLVINYVSGNNVSGYDLHRGIRRNVNGRIEEKDGQYALVLKEPGGTPLDGAFYLSMDKSAQRIAGRWVPTDSSRTHSGALNLTRGSDKPTDDDDDFFYADWTSDLGTLTFTRDNTCKLEYYPDSNEANSTAQLVTINGNYIRNVDTIRIDWQNNKRTPSLHMRLIRQPYKQVNSDSAVQANLQGAGLTFVKILAG